jgi:ferredoxin--NADP+ reductase
VDSFKVIENVRLSPHTFRLRTERPLAPIKAGQCFSVGTRDLGINREYSMYSGADDDYLDFLIREVDGGVVSPRLAACKPGDFVEIGGPYGEFCLRDDDVCSREFIFIASGTGIAPFHSFVQTYPNLKFTVIHGIRLESEQYERDHYANQKYVACISRPGAGIGKRITNYVEIADLDSEALVYLCGNRSMIVDTVALLRQRGIPGGSIFMETFF